MIMVNQNELLLNKKSWANDKLAIKFLAERLVEGNLLVCLGAGISRFYGLPGWDELLNGLEYKGKGHSIKKRGLSFPAWAEEIHNVHFVGETGDFRAAIQERLYGEELKKFDFLKIINNKSLRAIGALSGISKRGNVSKILTLNYDCLLEAYFHFHGYAVNTVSEPHFSVKGSDIDIYHPHGYIPHPDFSTVKSRDIVLTRADYEAAVKTRWQQTILHMLSTHFVLFIGLSGEDDRMSTLASDAMAANPFITSDEFPFYGYRICSKGTSLKSQWENRGIYCKEVGQLNRSIPGILFKICREAALLQR